jgi:hypothetical protein
MIAVMEGTIVGDPVRVSRAELRNEGELESCSLDRAYMV